PRTKGGRGLQVIWSKRLSYADIECIARIARAAVKRNGHVEPDRAKAGQITQAETGSQAHFFRKIREGLLADITGIEECHSADGIGDARAHLARSLDQRTSADHVAGRCFHPDAAIG